MSTEKNQFYSSKEVAELLNVTTRTVQLWADSGILDSWRTQGGHRRFAKETVDRLHRQNNKSQPISKPCSLRIVIVEDSPELLTLYRLTMMGWDIPLELILANNGFEGLLKIGAYKPHMLITDLNLPNMNGFQMIRSVLSNPDNSDIGIIIVSGLDKTHIRNLGELPESIPIYGKPIPFDEIKLLVSKTYQAIYAKSSNTQADR